MDPYDLPGTADAIDIGRGYRITAPHLTGRVQSRDARGEHTRALGGDPFDAMLEAAGLHQDQVVAVDAAAPAAGARTLGDDGAAVTLDVPHAPDERALVLAEDETGAVRWFFPEGHDVSAPGTGAARAIGGAGAESRFVIPVRRAAGAPGARGIGFGDVGKKLLKVFVYPVTDALLGPIVAGFARKWETKRRPYLVREYGPIDYKTDRPDFPALDADGWQRLAGGRALLFVHGTFSSCGAFSALAPEVMAELSRRYGGRTFAFNHFTLSDDPRQNASELLARIPAGVRLDVDIVCHSRGGLVAREIASLAAASGGRLNVGRVVMVGVPNAGTALADDDHMVDMIDRFTNVAKLIPPGTVQQVVDGAVIALKVLGHGFLRDLTGLRSMNPNGPFLPTLNVAGAGGPELFAIGSDFEPAPGSPWFSLTRAEDAALDVVFGGDANDLVVPRDGVFAAAGAGGFPVPDENSFRFAPDDAVIHTEYFSQSRTGAHLLDWLTGEAVVRDLATARAARATQKPPLTPAELAALRPHVVDLSEGKFRKSGDYYTPPEDVDAIFEQHLPAWAAALPADEPLRIVVFAHGGLVGERDGLDVAQKHVAWWKKNGVYPIYFVWETGLYDAVRSILEGVAARIPGIGRRDLADWTTDPLVEVGARALGGVKVWGAMKQNAALASASDGGARYLARKLAAFCKTSSRPVELHAVGHSAGSIFHSHFIPAAHECGAPDFRSLQFLAPAIRVDEFVQRLLPLVGNVAGRLTMYTMQRHYEEADNCASVYRKSLLYLIYNALEPARGESILGLELSIRRNEALKRLLGLDGRPGAAGEIVWSVTDASAGNAASRSISHGGFDDDPATMSSVAARVLGAATARVPYTNPVRALGETWPVSTTWLEAFDLTGVSAAAATLPDESRPAMTTGNGRPKPKPAPRVRPAPKPGTPPTGRRMALCIGIDAYPAPNTLAGCVNDAANWGARLGSLGFTVDYLRNADATYAGITERMRAMVGAAQPGDVLVFQYSGHGTLVPDLDGDEEGGGDDSAMVPVDFKATGGFLIDDDVRVILDGLAQGVYCTVFSDCCHSARNTRMLESRPPAPEPGAKARFLVLDDADVRRHEQFRARTGVGLAARGLTSRAVVGRSALRWVNFSACESTEVAYENNGSGDFTRLALGIVERGVGVTNGEFQHRVVEAFGSTPRQTPTLDCARGAEDAPLFGVQLDKAATPTTPTRATEPVPDESADDGSRGVREGPTTYPSLHDIATTLRGFATRLDADRA